MFHFLGLQISEVLGVSMTSGELLFQTDPYMTFRRQEMAVCKSSPNPLELGVVLYQQSTTIIQDRSGKTKQAVL